MAGPPNTTWKRHDKGIMNMIIKTMNNKNRLSLSSLSLAAAATLVAIPMAVQADATGSLSVSAQVAPVCEIVTTAPVAFGTLDPTIDNDTAGSVTWQCTTGTTTEILLNGGAQGATDGTARQMSDGGTNFLPYQLFTDFGRTNEWLNTSTNGVSVTGVGYLGGDTVSVYGRVAQADAAAAVNTSYTDTVTVTIIF